MRRGATLLVPQKWFIFNLYGLVSIDLEEVDRHMRLLKKFGCSEQALQWLDHWQEDFQMDAILYRFVSKEEETGLPLWGQGSRSQYVMVEELNAMCENTSRLKESGPNSSKELEVILSKGRRICRI